jgi:hypothetical protein
MDGGMATVTDRVGSIARRRLSGLRRRSADSLARPRLRRIRRTPGGQASRPGGSSGCWRMPGRPSRIRRGRISWDGANCRRQGICPGGFGFPCCDPARDRANQSMITLSGTFSPALGHHSVLRLDSLSALLGSRPRNAELARANEVLSNRTPGELVNQAIKQLETADSPSTAWLKLL